MGLNSFMGDLIFDKEDFLGRWELKLSCEIWTTNKHHSLIK